MPDGNVLSDAATRQIKGMFRDFYSRYVLPLQMRKRWFLGGGGPSAACDTAHEMSIEGNPTGGTFTWEYEIDSADENLEFDYDSTAAEAKTEFETHSGITSGNVDVTGGPLPNVALYVEFTDVSVTATPILNANALTTDSGDPFDPQPKLRLRA